MMHNPFQISLETLIGSSPLLGHPLEDRAEVRRNQNEELVAAWQADSTTPLSDPRQQDLFCVAPLDVLVSQVQGQKHFHIIELNGTGIGGLTNMSAPAVASVLSSLSQMGRQHAGEEALILVASSGKESESTPRLNRLIYEKLLYAEALKQGWEQAGQQPVVASMPQLIADPKTLHTHRPTVVVGYIKDFLANLTLTADGDIALLGRRVTGAVNDRFCLNVVSHFARQVNLSRLATMNRCFLAGGDKGVAYGLLNEYLAAHATGHVPRQVYFRHAENRERLITTVLEWLREGRRPVIKPHGTGLGHGIEFFLADESEEEVIQRVDRSIRGTEEFYAAPGGAFPYTVGEFIDTSTISCQAHPLFGHKYKLRVVVYREGTALKAFPSIVKISSEAFDPENPSRDSLINNVTSSAERTRSAGIHYLLPLANQQTLDLLGLSREDMAELCSLCTGYVGHVLDQLQAQPERFWLSASPGEDPSLALRVAA